MVQARIINETTPVEVTSENQETTVDVTSQSELRQVNVGGLSHKHLSGRDLPDQHPISAITNLQAVLDSKTDTSDLSNVAFSGSYNDLLNKPFIPSKTSDLENDIGYITDSALTGYATQNWVINQNYITDNYVGNAVLTIQRNNVDIDTFTANAKVDKTINIAVPTTAADVNALPDSTKYGYSIDLSLDTTDYKLTLTLKDQDGTILNSKTVDFPIESVVVNGTYDSINKKIVLTLQNGNTIDIPVGDLIAGLQTEITSENKLDADLVDDSTSTSKFVTSSEKTTWNGKQDAISDLSTIRAGASAGSTAVQPSDLATVATSGNYSDLNGKPTIPTATSDLTNDSGFITLSALTGYATESWVGQQGYLTSITSANVIAALGYTPYSAANPNGYITNSALAPYALSADLATVATSGLYSDLSGTPTIPTVNNATLTITQGGTTKGTFTANASSDVTIALDAGGGGGSYTAGTGIDITNNVISVDTTVIAQQSDIPTNNNQLTNGAGYITSSALSPYVLSSSLATVATTGSYNDLTNKPTIPAAQVNSDWNASSGIAQILNKPTIPTDTSDLTNGAGYITNSALSGYQTTSNLVTSLSSASTNAQYPSAKCVYDIVGDIESAINTIRGV